MKYWQPIALYVAVVWALYGTREVESTAERTQTAARMPKSSAN